MMKKLPVLAVVIASLPATAMAQSARSQAPPYCFDLSRIVDLAVTKERFASIAGQPRQVTFAIPVSSWPVGRTARSTERRAIPASPRRWRARRRPLRRKGQLAKRYGDQRALTDISFAVNAGEVLGLIGPNGAGKTTLMQAIAGTLSADAGHILWRGTSLSLPRRRELLFYLPDGVRPWEDQYAARVTELFAATYGRPEPFVAETVRLLGLAPALRKRFAALSKGYARRLLLALALLTPHPLLLMDEPFDGFDLRQTRDIMNVLRE